MIASLPYNGLNQGRLWPSVRTQEAYKYGTSISARWSEAWVDTKEGSVRSRGIQGVSVQEVEIGVYYIEIWGVIKIMRENCLDTSKRCVGWSGALMISSSLQAGMTTNCWYGVRIIQVNHRRLSASMKLQWRQLHGHRTNMVCWQAEEGRKTEP